MQTARDQPLLLPRLRLGLCGVGVGVTRADRQPLRVPPVAGLIRIIREQPWKIASDRKMRYSGVQKGPKEKEHT